VVGTAGGVRRRFEDIWAALPDELEIPERETRERALAELPFAPRARVLDLGCGAGHFTELILRRGAQVTAVDVADGALQRVRAIAPEATTVRIEPHGPWPFGDADFDALWCSETIEHVADTARWLDEAHRVLKPGAPATFTTPHHDRVRTALNILRYGPEELLDPRSDHVKYFTPRSLTSVLEDAGFTSITPSRQGRTLIATCVS
jgi:2-polyprenyl-3-methyl-5-hydroxy-6-metoxy-1,4-benzoquinol methylase